MTLAELGSRLREAREARGMTVADAADRLKISSRILQGVEDGSDRVPRTVYVYHYIKDYARLVGIPAADVSAMLEDLEGFENINRPVIADSAQYTSVKPSMLPTLLGVLFKAVVVLALAGGAYMAYLHFFEGREYDAPVPMPSSVDAPSADAPAGAPAAEAPAAPVWDVPAEPVPTGTPSAPSGASAAPQWEGGAAEAEADAGAAVSQPSLDAVPAGAVPAEAAPMEDEAVSQPPLPPAVPVVSVAEEVPAAPRKAAEQEGDAASSAAVEGEAALIPEGMHKVEVVADAGDCWLGFAADGRKQQRTLRKGDTFTLTFRDALTLKLGNAQAVRVVYDGQEQKRASSARVTTLTFPAE